jgi:hypothetical protein
MAKKKDAEIPKKHAGIPRTLAVAKKLGYKKSKTKFSDLSAELKGNFIKLADYGARTGSLCSIGIDIKPGYWHVCYKNESGQCHWVEIPKGSHIPKKDPS